MAVSEAAAAGAAAATGGLTTMRTLAGRYAGFILDQYGVLHNGTAALPGAEECFSSLHDAGKKMALLSNSSQRSEPTVQRMVGLGFPAEYFSGAATSGEAAFQRLLNDPPGAGRCVHVSWKSPSFVDELDNITRVDIDDADGVDFLLATGTDVINRADGSVVEMDTKTTGVVTDELKAIFAAGVERGLPLLVANPDTIYAGPNGYTAFCPGLLGTLYENMGGTVTYYGKPHAEHFQLCLDMLGLDLAEVAHVGDSLHHDVKGANGAGIASVFVAGGIHAKDLGIVPGEVPTEEALEALFEKEGIRPTYTVAMYDWK